MEQLPNKKDEMVQFNNHINRFPLSRPRVIVAISLAASCSVDNGNARIYLSFGKNGLDVAKGRD